jgi:acetyl esterase/lipase
MSRAAWRVALVPLAFAAAAPALAQEQAQPAPNVTYKPDGTVTLNRIEVPPSSLASPEGREWLRKLIVEKPFGSGPPLADIKAERARQDGIMHQFLAPMLKRYAVKMHEETIGGIVTDVVEPADGIAPENVHRVLINLHGGGFTTGGRSASLVESVPLAALMKIRVVSIDYRMGPEYRFPAASEDVEKVYRALLKTYQPQHMALYGCSAGGMLTAQSIAWFQARGLPNPAAIGVFCAGLGGFSGGDASVLALPLLGVSFQMPTPPKPGTPPARAPGYLDRADPTDPLAYPIVSTDVLAKFPPTLFISGTRSFEFSAALDSHNKLARAGVESQFYGWDGMFHGFFYSSEMRESREAYDVMVRFFSSHMAR